METVAGHVFDMMTEVDPGLYVQLLGSPKLWDYISPVLSTSIIAMISPLFASLLFLASANAQNWLSSPCPPPYSQICSRSDCGGRGECIGTTLLPLCFCDVGYFGMKCEMGSALTFANPGGSSCVLPSDCSNNGLCVFGKCVCYLGFQGDDCDEKFGQIIGNSLPTNVFADTGMCDATDCSNQGVCVGTKEKPFCLCYMGRIGSKCENTIQMVNGNPNAPLTQCSASDCSNKGLCLGTKASFVCACQLGYTGSRCESTPYPLCDALDCNSNGICLGTKDKFTCACHLGYSGDRCQTISGTMCESTDCNSAGICFGSKTQSTCVCALGYTGDRCQNRVGVLPGFEGAICETKDCSGNGLCFGSKLLPLCTCAPGFIGLRCELEPPCNPMFSCSGQGMCLGTVKSFSCVCNIGRKGTFCELPDLLG